MSQSASDLQQVIQAKLKAYKHKDDIKKLYLANKTDDDISLSLEIPLAQVVSQRESLGLPNRFTQGICYSSQDDETILTLRDDKYFRWTEIAKKLGKNHTSLNIQLRYRYLDGLRTRRNKNGEPDMRECNRCKQPFLSEGFHNRACESCRNSDERHVDYYCVTHTSSNWD
jgi:hypothetical protein